MIRTVLLAFTLVLVLAPAGATAKRMILVIKGGCARPANLRAEHYTDIFEAILEGVALDSESEPDTGRLEEPLYRLRFGILNRIEGKLMGVVETSYWTWRTPTQKEGERYLVFANRRKGGQLIIGPCGVLGGSDLETWLARNGRGEDVSGHLESSRQAWNAGKSEGWGKRRTTQLWAERMRQRFAEEITELRQHLDAGEEEQAFQTWILLRQRHEALTPTAARSSGRAATGQTGTDLEPELTSRLSSLLLKQARQARGAIAFREARRLWQQILMVEPGNEDARKDLTALDNAANKVFQEAYNRRKTDAALARAGLREVIRMTAVSSGLHARARQLLSKLKQAPH